MTALKSEGFECHYVNYRSSGSFIYKKPVLNVDEIVQKIIDLKTGIAAFSCVTDIFRTQLTIAEALKRRSPEIMTVFGGIHITALPEQVLDF